jgi:hypothetical protein
MMVGVKQRYRYRLYPHPHQQVALAKAFGCARVVWNDALAKSRELYAAGEKTSYPVLAKLCITQAKQPLKGPGCQAPAMWCCSSPCAIWIWPTATGGPA